MTVSQHNLQSSYREMVLEHLFVGAIMKHCWENNLPRIEMLKSQVDNSGYDIVLESGTVVRHIQLKASYKGAATPSVQINMELERKPSGCVVWMIFDAQSLDFCKFRWFGNQPGEKLPSLEEFPIATHTKRNAQGIKTERVNIRVVPRKAFAEVFGVEGLIQNLFGSQASEPQNIEVTESPKQGLV